MTDAAFAQEMVTFACLQVVESGGEGKLVLPPFMEKVSK